MYNKIPAKVKPTTTSARLIYANAFNSDFYLLLRERRCASLADMQDAALEVESNIMATENLKGNADRRRQRGESSSSSDPKIDKMTKMIESLTSEISKLKVEKHSGKGMVPNTFAPPNPNPYRRVNDQLQTLQRNKDANEDHVRVGLVNPPSGIKTLYSFHFRCPASSTQLHSARGMP